MKVQSVQSLKECHSSIGLFGQVVNVETDKNGNEFNSEQDPSSGLERRLGWVSISMVQLGDLIGGGILTMGAAFAELGWVLSIIFLVGFLFLNVYIGVVLSRARTIVPAAFTYEDMARYTFAKTWITRFIFVVLASWYVGTLGGYILAITDSLSMVFFDVPMCGPFWGLIVCACMTILLQIRSLSGTKYIVWANFLFILVVVFVTLINMIVTMDVRHTEENSTTYLVAQDLTWVNFMNGMSKVSFTYVGTFVYLQMMAEMKTPTDFPKTFYISGPFQIVVYMSVGVIAYLYDGANASNMTTKVINPHTNGIEVRVASFFLALHLAISYLIFSTVFCRELHNKISPATVNDFGVKGQFVWSCISFSLLLLAYIVSNAMPLFDQILALIGALQSPIIGYILPPLFLIFARKRAGLRTDKLEYFVLVCIVIFGVASVFMGTAANVIAFLDAMKAQGKSPFECKHESYLTVWNQANHYNSTY